MQTEAPNPFEVLQEGFRQIISEEIEKVVKKLTKKEVVLLRRDEVAKMFKVTEQTVWEWVKYKILPKPIKMGSIPYWRLEDIEKIVNKSE